MLLLVNADRVLVDNTEGEGNIIGVSADVTESDKVGVTGGDGGDITGISGGEITGTGVDGGESLGLGA